MIYPSKDLQGDKGGDHEPAAIAEATPLWDHQTSVLLADFHIHS